MNEQVIDYLNQMRFYGIKESLDFRLAEAMQENLDYTDFLTTLLEDESIYRRNKRSETLRKRAKFKTHVAFEEFKASPKRGVPKALIKQFQTLHFIEGNENLVFVGGTGAGKSFLAQAIGHHACASCIETFFISINRLFKEIEAQDASGTYLNYMAKLSRFKLLILDDLGLRNYSHKEANILYEILEDRYQKGPVIITSQVKPQGWKTLFEDKVIAEAILDRLTNCAHIIEVKGESFRTNHSPKKMLENVAE
ncbi:MAG: IS21-like element helper ATPase IstB [Bdellovibrionales bacterium]|nr:IS21-like element helper ATPase IstB [Bdellovibrionales bacterium]